MPTTAPTVNLLHVARTADDHTKIVLTFTGRPSDALLNDIYKLIAAQKVAA
jgi:hypothetical protein